MIELQALNKILSTKELNFLIEEGIDRNFFVEYSSEFDFILNHYNTYGNVPDIETFINKFQSFDILDVKESKEYILDALRENNLYNQSIPIMENANKLYKEDSNKAVEYVASEFSKLKPNYRISQVDLIEDAINRYNLFIDRKNNPGGFVFNTGLPELDIITGGIQRTEELFIIFARTNQGKSWVAEKIALSVWEQGYNVGYFSPEMSSTLLGYRLDTMFNHFSNRGLMFGTEAVDEKEYEIYAKNLSNSNRARFSSTILEHFDNRVTVSKIKSWIKQYDLKLVVIDGITYMEDERYKRGDSTTTSLTNISKDLISLSVSMGVPIIGVVQANRNAAGEDKGSPTLETIRDSDGISHSATRVMSVRNKDKVLELVIQKNRLGYVGNKLLYDWNIDLGKFIYVPNPKSGLPDDLDQKIAEENKEHFNDTHSVF